MNNLTTGVMQTLQLAALKSSNKVSAGTVGQYFAPILVNLGVRLNHYEPHVSLHLKPLCTYVNTTVI